ncbi:MAG: hypothetical protein AB7Q42_17130 [Acidimicrobiia bacterium]
MSAGTTDVGTVVVVGATVVVVVASTVVAGGLVDVDGGELVLVRAGDEVVVIARGSASVEDVDSRSISTVAELSLPDAASVSALSASLVDVGIRVADPLTMPSSAHALAIVITPTNTATGTRLANMHRGYARRADVWHRPALLRDGDRVTVSRSSL